MTINVLFPPLFSDIRNLLVDNVANIFNIYLCSMLTISQIYDAPNDDEKIGVLALTASNRGHLTLDVKAESFLIHVLRKKILL